MAAARAHHLRRYRSLPARAARNAEDVNDAVAAATDAEEFDEEAVYFPNADCDDVVVDEDADENVDDLIWKLAAVKNVLGRQAVCDAEAADDRAPAPHHPGPS